MTLTPLVPGSPLASPRGASPSGSRGERSPVKSEGGATSTDLGTSSVSAPQTSLSESDSGVTPSLKRIRVEGRPPASLDGSLLKRIKLVVSFTFWKACNAVWRWFCGGVSGSSTMTSDAQRGSATKSARIWHRNHFDVIGEGRNGARLILGGLPCREHLDDVLNTLLWPSLHDPEQRQEGAETLMIRPAVLCKTEAFENCLEHVGIHPITPEQWRKRGIEFRQSPGEDFKDIGLDALQEDVQFVEGHLSQGKSVLVHCKAGVGRSAMVALGWLIKYVIIPEIEARSTHVIGGQERPCSAYGVWGYWTPERIVARAMERLQEARPSAGRFGKKDPRYKTLVNFAAKIREEKLKDSNPLTIRSKA